MRNKRRHAISSEPVSADRASQVPSPRIIGGGSYLTDHPDRKMGKPPIATRGEPSTSPDVMASLMMQGMIMNDDDKEWYAKLFKKQAKNFLKQRNVIKHGVGMNPTVEHNDNVIRELDHRMDSYGVFIPVPIETVRRLEKLCPAMLTRSAVDDSPLHITVLYIGKIDEAQAERARAICGQVLSGLEPFEIELCGTSHFMNDDGNIFHISVKSNRLVELHYLLRSSLETGGVSVKHTYGDGVQQTYTPHITLAYLPKTQVETEIPIVGSWIVDRVEVWNMSSPVSLKLSYDTCLACAAGLCKNHIAEAKELLLEPDDEVPKKKKRKTKREFSSVAGGSIDGAVQAQRKRAKKT